MARIPSFVQVAPTFQGIDMPQGAFNATGRAVAGVIQQVGGAVDTVKKFVDEAQNIRNQQDIRDTSREMRTMQAQFQEEILSNSIDPANWTSEWEKRLAGFESDLKGRNFPPVVANAAESQFKDFAGQSLISVSANALKENRRRATGSWEIDYNDAIKNERYDQARDLVNEADEAGILDPVQRKAADFEIKDKEQLSDVQLDIELDPQMLIDQLEKDEYRYKFSPNQKIKILDEARKTISTKEKYAMGQLKNGLARGAFRTKEELEAELERYPEISDSTKKLVLFNYDNIKPVESEEKFTILEPLREAAKAFARGEITIEQYGVTHDETQTAVYALGERNGAGALKSALNNYDPANMAGGEADAAREAMKKKFESGKEIATDLIKERAKGYVSSRVGAFKDVNAGVVTGKAKDIAELTTTERTWAILFEERMGSEVDKFLARPHAVPPTDTDILAHIDSVQPAIVESIERDIKNPKPLEYKTDESTGQKGNTTTPQVAPKSENARRIDEWLNDGNDAQDSLLPFKE